MPPLGLVSPAASTPSTAAAVRDLELMHKFSTETYESLCTGQSEFHAWQVIIPRHALQYDFLMNGILALAALHIATTIDPPASWAYIDTALQYHSLSFAPFRSAIDNLTPLNCEAVLAQSIVTTVIGIALPRLTAERDESPSMTENIVVVFELLQGVKKIITIGRSWIKLNLFTHKEDSYDHYATLDTATQTALTRLATLNDEMLAMTDPVQHKINTEVVSHLRRCYARFVSTDDPANVLAWLAAVDKGFVENVRRRQPFPLLVLMHWGVLLGELHGQRWWARESGRALVSELLQALRPGDIQWKDALLWPQEKMGL